MYKIGFHKSFLNFVVDISVEFMWSQVCHEPIMLVNTIYNKSLLSHLLPLLNMLILLTPICFQH